MSSLEFDVYGAPKTQGSMRAFAIKGGKGARVTSDNTELAPWRDSITSAAILAKPDGWVPIDTATAVYLKFYMPRPASYPKTIDVLPIKDLDLDKLERAIGDSLTNAAIIVDDARIVRFRADQVYAVGPHLPKIYNPHYHRAEPGVHIFVRTITREEIA